jgi:hypothetical protein
MGVTAFNRGSRAVSQRIDVEMQLTRNSYRSMGTGYGCLWAYFRLDLWVIMGVNMGGTGY